MLALDPEKRLTLQQIKDHAWMNVVVPDLAEKVKEEYFKRAKAMNKKITKETHEASLNVGNQQVMKGAMRGGPDNSGPVFFGKVGQPSKELNQFFGVSSLRTIINSCNPDTSEEELLKILAYRELNPTAHESKYKIKFCGPDL